VTDLEREGAAAWEAIADGWAERVRTNTDWVRPLILDRPHLELLGDVRGKRILDAGCGEGRFARMLAERGALVTAVDLSARMITNATALERENPLGIDYRHQSMCNLSDMESRSFDAAVAYLSLLDVADDHGALREIARVLKDRGRFSFSVVHPCFYTPDSAWEPRKPGTIPLRDADKLYRKVDGYFPSRELRFRMWPTAPAETINYHRTITDISRATLDAGFMIRRIVEPLPDAELAERLDYLKEHSRAPGMMIFDCVKART
jgi:SAM-dependent methyltransferase